MYIRKKITKFAVISLILLLISTGCSTNEYTEFVTEFEKIYYEVAQNIDIEHTYDSLKRLQSEDNIKNINEMGTLLMDIKSKVPSNKEKHFEELQKQYNGITFLRDCYNKWDYLTKDEKQRINTEVWWAYSLYRDYEKDKQ